MNDHYAGNDPYTGCGLLIVAMAVAFVIVAILLVNEVIGMIK